VADTSFSGIRVARKLNRLVIERGKPKMGGQRQRICGRGCWISSKTTGFDTPIFHLIEIAHR